ncbi:MAG: hypothetical protein IKZ92_09155 [Muribaculaceae bacterium]|nr:hypothetical protein [Muribaculaceae bacterium]
MNRKRAIIALAIIETLIYITIFVLMEFGKISFRAYLIAFVIVTVITLALLFVINRKFPPMDDE